MKDVALIAVNLNEDCRNCSNVEQAIGNTLGFLDKIDSVMQDTDEVIFGTFPILFLGSYSKRLAAYASDGLEFQLHPEDLLASENAAGQSAAEVLDLLDIHNVYVCGIRAEKEIRQICLDLQKSGLKMIVLKDCIAYQSVESYSNFLGEMESLGIKMTK